MYLILWLIELLDIFRPDIFDYMKNDETLEEVPVPQMRPKRKANVQLEMEYREFNSDSELILSPSNRDKELLDQLDCGPTKCTHMVCTVGPLRKKESVVFRLYSRLWSSTVSQLAHHQYEISSRLVSVVTKLPHNVDPSFLDIKSYTGKLITLPTISDWSLHSPKNFEQNLKIEWSMYCTTLNYEWNCKNF